MTLHAAVAYMLATTTVAVHSPSPLRPSSSDTDKKENPPPEWVLHPHRGRPPWSCEEASWDSCTLPECGREGRGIFHDAKALSLPGFNLTSVAYRIDWLAETRCSITYSGNLQRDSPFRVVVDSMFENAPRCCSGIQNLSKSQDGSMPHFSETLPDGDFVRIDPSVHECTEDDQCALVLEFPGSAIIPWLMFQDSCQACQQTLHSVLIHSACVEEDCLHKEIIPSVQSIIANEKAIDDEKVYLVSASKGNENALKAAMHYPGVFKMVAMAGKFYWGRAGSAMFTDDTVQSLVELRHRKLVSLQFHIGDNDDNRGPDWWTDFTKFAERWPHHGSMLSRSSADGSMSSTSFAMDIYIYPEAAHPIWYATWNALHDSIWLGMPFDDTGRVFGTCMGMSEGG